MSKDLKGPEIFPVKMTIENYEIAADVVTRVDGTKRSRWIEMDIREDASMSYERRMGERNDDLPHAATLQITLPSNFDEHFMPRLARELSSATPKDGFQSVDEVERAVTKAAIAILQNKEAVVKVPYENRLSQFSRN